MAVGVAELHGYLTAGAPAAVEVDGDAVLFEMVPGAEDVVEGGDLERQVVKLPAGGSLAGLADEAEAVVVPVEAHEHHPARHHALGIDVGHLEAEHLGVEADGGVDVPDHQHGVSHVADAERHVGGRLEVFHGLDLGAPQPLQVDLASLSHVSCHVRFLLLLPRRHRASAMDLADAVHIANEHDPC